MRKHTGSGISKSDPCRPRAAARKTEARREETTEKIDQKRRWRVACSSMRWPLISDTVPLAVGKWYDFQEIGWHLGNVGSIERKGFTP